MIAFVVFCVLLSWTIAACVRYARGDGDICQLITAVEQKDRNPDGGAA